MFRKLAGALALGFLVGLAGMSGARAETRIALVIGSANYTKAPLRTPLVDGGLLAETLNSAGFEIVEGADVNQADLRRIFRDFLGKVEAAGPDTIVFVYLSGYGLAFEGENYFVPADAQISRETDIPLEAVRLSDLTKPLAAGPAKVKAVVVDASRPHPFKLPDVALPDGLVAVSAPPGMLIAFASAPGTVVPEASGDYGPFAIAISEMLREPGLDLDAVFTRIRVRTHQMTQGQQTPWYVSALSAPIVIVPPAAPVAAAPSAPVRPRRQPRPMRELAMDEAYAIAIEQDSLHVYAEFVEVYPRSPYAPRVWAMIRARREALAWMRALEFNTPDAYWTYLRRYPNGIYADDARRRLRRLAALLEPPPAFALLDLPDVPPPLPNEPIEYFAVYPVAPPPPVTIIEPVPAFYLSLPPPPPPRRGFLVAPVSLPVVSPSIRRPPRGMLVAPGAIPRGPSGPAVLTPAPSVMPHRANIPAGPTATPMKKQGVVSPDPNARRGAPSGATRLSPGSAPGAPKTSPTSLSKQGTTAARGGAAGPGAPKTSPTPLSKQGATAARGGTVGPGAATKTGSPAGARGVAPASSGGTPAGRTGGAPPASRTGGAPTASRGGMPTGASRSGTPSSGAAPGSAIQRSTAPQPRANTAPQPRANTAPQPRANTTPPPRAAIQRSTTPPSRSNAPSSPPRPAVQARPQAQPPKTCRTVNGRQVCQ